MARLFADHRILNFIWVVFGLTICGLPNKVIQVVNPILTAEALDYMEWKHGLRNEALVTTVQGYFTKLATSITSWMSGMVLTWINYIPLTDSLGNAVPQTDPGILSGIWAVFCILPGLARGLYGLSFLFYNIHGDLQQQMIVELAEKRAARLAEQNEKNCRLSLTYYFITIKKQYGSAVLFFMHTTDCFWPVYEILCTYIAFFAYFCLNINNS